MHALWSDSELDDREEGVREMKVCALLAALLLLVACDDPKQSYRSPLQRVRVVDVVFYADHDDWKTTIEFPNGTRGQMVGRWGNIGDEFNVQTNGYGLVYRSTGEERP